MNLEVTELIEAQVRIVTVMFCAGILVGSLWQCRKRIQYHAKSTLARFGAGCIFWTASAVVLSSFMYYGSYGRITL